MAKISVEVYKSKASKMKHEKKETKGVEKKEGAAKTREWVAPKKKK